MYKQSKLFHVNICVCVVFSYIYTYNIKVLYVVLVSFCCKDANRLRSFCAGQQTQIAGAHQAARITDLWVCGVV